MMVDFKAQLKKGLAAHQHASAAKNEVSAILQELSRQVEEYTNGRVGVKLKRDTASLLASQITNAALFTTGRHITSSLNIEYSLIAYDKSGETGIEENLASWTLANTGYPCVLRFDDTKHEAYDRKSLESVLGDLLASPETGRAISAIVSKTPKVIEGDDEAASEPPDSQPLI